MSQQSIIVTPFGALVRESIRDINIYIADYLAPPISSDSESSTYRYATKQEIKRSAKTTKNAAGETDNRVGPGGAYNTTESVFGTDTFLCVKRGEEAKLTAEDKARSKNYFNSQRETSQRAIFSTLKYREMRVVASALDASFPTAAAAIGWGANPTTAKPFKDVNDAATALRTSLGMAFSPFSNLVGIMNPVDYTALTETDDFKDRFKFTQSGMRTPETLQAIAQALGLADLRIASATNDDGSYIWTTGKVGLYFISTTENMEADPRALNQFYWDEFEDGFMYTEMTDVPRNETEFHKAREYRTQKIINKYAGYVITGTNAA